MAEVGQPVAQWLPLHCRVFVQQYGRVVGQFCLPQACYAKVFLAVDENEVCREIFFAFSKAGKAILRMTAGKASLEDIFMELTDSGKGEETK